MLTVWRHPKPDADVRGLCIGRTDLPVDRRKAKRLAHRIRHWARSNGGQREVWTSPLQRAADVGRWLARWGWRHRVDARLAEMDFGAWDGMRWEVIGGEAVEAWCADFALHAPGGGESVAALLVRCDAIRRELEASGAPVCIVGHAGWISAARWLDREMGRMPNAAEWPGSARYGERIALRMTPSPSGARE
ncbi:hypothetical protein BH11PSE9_BH11PSE9_28230 [soil metagenome]